MKLVAQVLLLAGLLVSPALGDYDEPFVYPDGQLADNDGWYGEGPTLTDISVVSEEVKVAARTGGSGGTVYTWVEELDQAGDGLVATIQIKKGTGAGAAGNFWYLQFGDTISGDLGLWYGTQVSARPRMGGVAGPGQTLTGGWDELKMVINFTAGTTDFYFNDDGDDLPIWSATHSGKIELNIVEFYRHERDDLPGHFVNFDNLHVTEPPPPPCYITIAPEATQSSAAPVGGAALPSSHTYTVRNDSGTALIYSVGVTEDWLGWSWGPLSDGTIGLGEEETVNALIDPLAPDPDLAAGVYSGHVTFADDCDPNGNYQRPLQLAVGSDPCVMDLFPYPDGLLKNNRNGGLVWEGDGDFKVAGEAAKIDLDTGTLTWTMVGVGLEGMSCGPCENGKITALGKVFFPSTNAGGAAGLFEINDENGYNFGQWELMAAPFVRGRIAGSNTMSAWLEVTPDAWHELKMVIDTVNDQTAFYVDDDGDDPPLGTLPHGAEVGVQDQELIGDSVGSITLSDRDRDDTSVLILIDDVRVLGCLDTCYAAVEPGGTPLPWAEKPGSAATPGSTDYTVTNISVEAFPTGFAVTKTDETGENPAVYPWLNVGTPTGTQLDPDEEEVLTVTYDTTQAEVGLNLGYLKFTDDCDPDASYIRPIKLNVDDCINEPFDYTNGRLDTKPAWSTETAHLSPSPIAISGNVLRITGGGATGPEVVVNHDRIDNCPATCPQGGLIVVTFKVHGGTGASRFWRLHITDTSGNDHASWRGMAGQFEYGVQGYWYAGGSFTGTVEGVPIWDEMEARINVSDTETVAGIPPNSTKFYFKGQPIATNNPLTHAAGDRVRRIQIRRIGDAAVTEQVEIDDLVVSRCRSLCNDPFADAEGPAGIGYGLGDGDVDQQDFAVLQLCMTGQGGGPIPSSPAYCACFDRGADSVGDDDIDSFDLDAFEACASGPDVLADETCDDPPPPP